MFCNVKDSDFIIDNLNICYVGFKCTSLSGGDVHAARFDILSYVYLSYQKEVQFGYV